MLKRFMRYPSIENSDREKAIDTIISIVPKDEMWCVLEKIHGSNIQLYYDEKGFAYGKRSSFISGSFYNAHNILPKYEEQMKAIYEEHKKPIRIFGEIFGGKYNDKYANTSCVQKEVEYCQEIDVIFYDLMIGEDMINYCTAVELFNDFKIPYLIPLKVCGFEEALNYKNNFDSLLCIMFNLPVVEGNTAEGIVIKPFYKEYKSHFGSRVILKSKNEKFTEKRKAKKVKKLEVLSDSANKLIAELESYMTENRFNAVYSKDKYTKKDFGMFLGNFILDLREDAKKDNVEFDTISLDETKRVNKMVNRKAVMFIKKLFFDRVEF